MYDLPVPLSVCVALKYITSRSVERLGYVLTHTRLPELSRCAWKRACTADVEVMSGERSDRFVVQSVVPRRPERLVATAR